MTSAEFASHLESIDDNSRAMRDREYLRAINSKPERGYYVSAMDDNGRKMLVEGPFALHVEALVAVRGVSRAWGESDPRAHWYAWGTAGVGIK